MLRDLWATKAHEVSACYRGGHMREEPVATFPDMKCSTDTIRSLVKKVGAEMIPIFFYLFGYI